MSRQDFGDDPYSNKENTLPHFRISASSVSPSESTSLRQLNTTPRPSILGSSRLSNRITGHPLETFNPAGEIPNHSKHLQQYHPLTQSSNPHLDNGGGQTSGRHCYLADDWRAQEDAFNALGASTDEVERGDFTIPLSQITQEEAAQIGDAHEVGENDCQYSRRSSSVRTAKILMAMLA